MHGNAYLHERNNEFLTGSVLYTDFGTGVVLDTGIKGEQSQHFSVLLIDCQPSMYHVNPTLQCVSPSLIQNKPDCVFSFLTFQSPSKTRVKGVSVAV